MMNVRRTTIVDYEEIIGWWKKQNRAILGWDILPVMGFMAHEGGQNLVVSWLYCSDSVTGFVAWTTINPDASKRKIRDALRMMEECVEGASRMVGLKILFQFSGGGGFSKLLLKSGWKNTLIKHDFLMKEI